MSGTPAYLLPWYLRIPVAFRLATNYWTPIKDARAAWIRWKMTSPYPGRLRAAWPILLGRPPELPPGAPPLPGSGWYPWTVATSTSPRDDDEPRDIRGNPLYPPEKDPT